MKLQITKHTGKPHVIKYTRDDGSVTWMNADDFFVMHDLSHFAIEKTMHYTSAFMGMLNKGMDIKDFENKEKRKELMITKEAVYAENMANLFLMEILQGNFEDFNEVARQSFKSMNTVYPAPELTATQQADTKDLLQQLLIRWKELPEGQTMTLTFDF